MSAQVIYLADRMPQSQPLPLPTIPSLAVMTITLQRNHLYECPARERLHLFRASMHLMMGDCDERAHVEHLERVHRIWLRVMNPTPGGAA